MDAREDREYGREEQFQQIIDFISEDIILDNIQSQIDNMLDPESVKTRSYNSLFTYIEDRMKFMVNSYPEPDKVSEIWKLFSEVLDKISKPIEDQLEIEIEYSDVIQSSRKVDYVKSLYSFFVIDMSSHLEDLVYNYIIKEKDSLKTKYDSLINKDDRKNLSYVHLKNIIDNDYTPMIFSVDDIVKGMEIEFNEDIIDYMINLDPTEFVNYNMDCIFIDNEFVDVNFNKNLMEKFRPLLISNHVLIRNVKNKLITRLGGN